jgi:hypothetical protein
LEKLEGLGVWEASPLVWILFLFDLLTVPPIALRAMLYHAKHRTDWDVLVFSGAASASTPPRQAAKSESCLTKTDATQRAEEIWQELERSTQVTT